MPFRLRCRARFIVLVASLLCLLPVRSFAQERPAPLQGLNAVTASISLAGPTDALPTGLTENRLQTLAGLKLRSWALRVVSREEAATIAGITPHVELEVTMLETRAVEKLAGYAYFMRLVVTEPATSLRNGASVTAELWSHSFLGVSDRKNVVGDIERSTGELLDQFVNEWLRSRHSGGASDH